MRLSLAAARKYVLVICMRLLTYVQVMLSNPNYGESISQRCCVPEEGSIPYCLQGPSTYT